MPLAGHSDGAPPENQQMNPGAAVSTSESKTKKRFGRQSAGSLSLTDRCRRGLSVQTPPAGLASGLRRTFRPLPPPSGYNSTNASTSPFTKTVCSSMRNLEVSIFTA
jgi:hypothetical protein